MITLDYLTHIENKKICLHWYNAFTDKIIQFVLDTSNNPPAANKFFTASDKVLIRCLSAEVQGRRQARDARGRFTSLMIPLTLGIKPGTAVVANSTVYIAVPWKNKGETVKGWKVIKSILKKHNVHASEHPFADPLMWVNIGVQSQKVANNSWKKVLDYYK